MIIKKRTLGRQMPGRSLKKISDTQCAIIPVTESSPIAYMNVFEEGDLWIKIEGCANCDVACRTKCCNQCALLHPELGCTMQLTMRGQGLSNKPLYCVIKPDVKGGSRPGCRLKYECVRGSRKGKIRDMGKPLPEGW